MNPIRTSFSLTALSRFFMAAGKNEFPEADSSTNFIFEFLRCRLRYRFAIVIFGLAGAICGLGAPFYQKIFIDTLVENQSFNERILLFIKLIGMTFLFSIISQILFACARLICVHENLHAQRWLSKSLYDFTLRLSHKSRSMRTVGETVSIYAQDVAAVAALLDELMPNVVSSLIPLVAAPIAVVLLYSLPIVPVLLTMFICVGLCLTLGFLQSGHFATVKHDADLRTSVVNEWLQNIRVIRSLGWTEYFEQKIFYQRRKESADRLRMVTNGSSMNSIAQVTPLIINVVAVLSLIKVQNGLVSPGEVFSLLWIFGVFLSRPVRMLPWALVIGLDAATSNRRLRSFFQSHSESEPSAVTPWSDETEGTLDIEHLNLTINGRKLLSDIHFKINAGEFVAIVGEVGSGKSIFLQSLLRETEATFGRYFIGKNNAQKAALGRVRSSFSYVPQNDFVMSATLRDNINFAYDSPVQDDNFVLKALSLAEFHCDAENVPGGISTEIGERGVNLSGGQRQRISLARALRFDTPIVLLDDCLSALDVETEQKITQKLLLGHWKNKTRILVTHRLSVLTHCDRVFVMKDGYLLEEKKT